jgi:ribosomal protein L40E
MKKGGSFMELWERFIAIILILIGIGLLAYSIRKLRKESKTPPQPKVYCSSCGTENSPEATFCVKCGKKIASQQQSTNSDKSEEKDAEDKEADTFFNAGKDDDLIFPEDGI